MHDLSLLRFNICIILGNKDVPCNHANDKVNLYVSCSGKGLTIVSFRQIKMYHATNKGVIYIFIADHMCVTCKLIADGHGVLYKLIADFLGVICKHVQFMRVTYTHH